jgi:LmbE family N-acetylglucosaminyl deacetylase
MKNIETAFVLAPHPDDGEFSCGASIKRLTEEGVKVFYIAFSPCIKSVPEGLPKDILYKELAKATASLGIPQEQVITFDYPVREFPKYRQEILEDLIRLRKVHQPDLVLMPNSQDVHQDHHTIYEEGLRAFKHACLLGYELPWNNLHFSSNFHFKVSKSQLEAKWKAISAYESQSFRSYKSYDFFEGLARVRGTQVASEFAEGFELIRWIA